MPHTQRTFDLIESKVEWFRSIINNAKTMLYIGWRHDTKRWWHDKFPDMMGIDTIDVVDIFRKNIDDLNNRIAEGKYAKIHKVIWKDLRDLDNTKYDVVFWDHGPEHVSAEDLKTCTDKLKSITNKMLLYCCPWGEWPQGEEDGNKSEIHLNYVTVQELLDLNMEVITTGTKGQIGEGELIAFSFLNEYSIENLKW